MMKTHLTIALLIVSLPCALTAQDAETSKPDVIKFNDKTKSLLKALDISEDSYKKIVLKNRKSSERFKALPQETKDKFAKLVREAAAKLRGQKRNASDALNMAIEATNIQPDSPAALSIIAHSYIELRDFDSARETYAKILKVDPLNMSVRFNAAETDFVDKKYGAALAQFKLLTSTPEVRSSIKNFIKLIEFKIDLCHLAESKNKKLTQDQRDAHRKAFDTTVDARTLRNDHTLLTYYSKAAKSFDAEDKEKAADWIRKSRIAYPHPGYHGNWVDTMVEFGYLSSLYKEKEEK